MERQNDIFNNTEFLDQIFGSNNFSYLQKLVKENTDKILENKTLCLKIISKSITIMEAQKREINEKDNEINVKDKMIKEYKITQNEYDKYSQITLEKSLKLYKEKMVEMEKDLMIRMVQIEEGFNNKLKQNDESWNRKLTNQIKENNESWNEKLTNQIKQNDESWNKNLTNQIKENNESWNEKLTNQIKQNDESWNKKLTNQIKQNNESWNEKLNEQKINLKILEINFKVENFRRNIENLINYKRHYLTNLKVDCLEKEIELNEIDKTKLTLLCNDFYSFRNIAVYRKIINILLKKIIDLYLKDLIVENKNNKKYIKADKKLGKYNDLNNIISFFFFFKKKSSLILHFLEDVEGVMEKLNKKEPFKLQIIENMKGTKDFLKDIKEKCSYQKLINTLLDEKPLLFYDENYNSKEKVESEIKSLLISLNKKLEKEFVNNYNELFEDLKNQEKAINDMINKNEYSNNVCKEFDIELKKLKNEEDSLKEIKKLNKEKEEIFINFTQVISNKKDPKKMFFTMVDFISLYKKDFSPFEICSKLFDDETKKEELAFMDEDVKDFVEYFENKKNS